MPDYLIAMYQPDGPIPSPEVLEPIMRQLGELKQEMTDAGAWVFGNGLHPVESATVVRASDGEILMTDGPYLEGREHLGGFDIVSAPDLDAALEWGRRIARITGLPIEVRPFYDREDRNA